MTPCSYSSCSQNYKIKRNKLFRRHLIFEFPIFISRLCKHVPLFKLAFRRYFSFLFISFHCIYSRFSFLAFTFASCDGCRINNCARSDVIPMLSGSFARFKHNFQVILSFSLDFFCYCSIPLYQPLKHETNLPNEMHFIRKKTDEKKTEEKTLISNLFSHFLYFHNATVTWARLVCFTRAIGDFVRVLIHLASGSMESAPRIE